MTQVTLVDPGQTSVRAAVLALAPFDDEIVYSNRARETLPAAEANLARFPVAMLDDTGTPVGFLVLDLSDRSRRYAASDEEIGVHGFFVDRRYRRLGYARAAVQALPAYVRKHHPQIRTIALTVNVDNGPAVAAYLAGGMRDTGEVFFGGTNGPQHVLRLPLR